MRYHVSLIQAVFVSAALTCCSASPQSPKPQPKTYTVAIEGMVFRPATLQVAAGDTVVWVNKDLVPHAAATSPAGFDSKVLEFSKSYSHTFTTAGDFAYVCPFHPTMKGLIQVHSATF